MFLTRDLPATSKGSVSHLLLFRPRDRILGLNILLLCTVPPTHLGTIGQTPERPQLWPTKMPPAMVFPWESICLRTLSRTPFAAQAAGLMVAAFAIAIAMLRLAFIFKPRRFQARGIAGK